jgi:biopolymer transport protein ExbD
VAAEPNVTPFIDVLLVLLVIFMVAQGIRSTLPVQTPPPGPAAGPEPAEPQIVLALGSDGGYAINGQPVPAPQLVEQLRAIYATRPAKLLFVDAAPPRTYQEVIAAMDLARGAGAAIVAFMPRAEAAH